MISAFLDRVIRRMGWLDVVAEAVQSIVGGFFKVLGKPGSWLKTALHGSWLGHPLHPVFTDLPVGAWSVALAADVASITGHLRPEVGTFAVLVGVVGGLGAVVTGYTDFHETYGHERRLGIAHGLMNSAALGLYAASMLMRLPMGSGLRMPAFVLSLAGFALVMGSGYIGGHMVMGVGTTINRSAFLEGPEKEYVEIGAPVDFEEGRMKKVMAGGLEVFVVRYQGKVYAMSNTCSHAGGPLDEGELEGGAVSCPWHGSRFRLADGAIRRGPATFRQPVLAVREVEGRVEVKLREPLQG
jgi:nitrite reductase/ring-hydroxylating ferredoxin subunit/uncharacterized membrane protein